MSNYKKSMIDTMLLVIVAAALLATFFIIIQINNFVGIIKIKGEVNVLFDVQDRGTQMLSFMSAQKTGPSYISMLGSYAASGVPPEYENEITSTLQKLGQYDLFIQNQNKEIIKEFKSSSSPSGGGYIQGAFKLTWPVKNYNSISSGYGWRDLAGKKDFHGGIDFAVAQEDVYSVYPTGKVVSMNKGCDPSPIACTGSESCSTSTDSSCCCNGGLGNYVILQHEINGKTLYTSYYHLSKDIYVHQNDELGKNIKPEDPIAKSGNSGLSTGYHLHFRLSSSVANTDDTSMDPCLYFPDPVPANCEQESQRTASITVAIPLPNGQVGNVGLII